MFLTAEPSPKPLKNYFNLKKTGLKKDNLEVRVTESLIQNSRGEDGPLTWVKERMAVRVTSRDGSGEGMGTGKVKTGDGFTPL